MTAPLSPAKQARIARLAAKGAPPHHIAHLVGVSRNTVAKYSPPPALTPSTSLPFGPGNRPPANVPPVDYSLDQPPPPPENVTFRPGYHDRTFKAFAAPLGFDGWTIDRIRNAIAAHDQGMFIESYLLMINVTRFGPVYAALEQAIAPTLALPRQILGGTRGLSRVLALDIEAQLAPRDGLQPSPYFPPTLFGATAIERRMMGFAVWQHVYGDPDPLTGVRKIYTRRWPTWAVNYYPSRRTFVALTDSGPVDIITGDGKFTLVADDDEPHHAGAIRPLGLEVLAGVLSDQALASYIDMYGNPKLWATMPPNVAVDSAEGRDFFDALGVIIGPNGRGAIPYGAKLDWAQLSAAQSTMFKDADEKISARCYAILLGSNGTGMAGTGGVYLSPTFQGVARTITSRLLLSIVRAANAGHIAPYLEINYAAGIAESRGWIAPVLDIPLPDPDADARRKAYAERAKERTEIITSERSAGLDVTQERVDQLSASLGLETIPLAAVTANVSQIQLAPTDIAKVVRVDEARASQGLPPLGDSRGKLTISELDAQTTAPTKDDPMAPASAPLPESDPDNDDFDPAPEEPADPNALAESDAGEDETEDFEEAAA